MTVVCLGTSPPCPASLLSCGQKWCPWSAPSRPRWHTAGTGFYQCPLDSQEPHSPSGTDRQTCTLFASLEGASAELCDVFCIISRCLLVTEWGIWFFSNSLFRSFQYLMIHQAAVINIKSQASHIGQAALVFWSVIWWKIIMVVNTEVYTHHRTSITQWTVKDDGALFSDREELSFFNNCILTVQVWNITKTDNLWQLSWLQCYGFVAVCFH